MIMFLILIEEIGLNIFLWFITFQHWLYNIVAYLQAVLILWAHRLTWSASCWILQRSYIFVIEYFVVVLQFSSSCTLIQLHIGGFLCLKRMTGIKLIITAPKPYALPGLVMAVPLLSCLHEFLNL